MQITDEMVEAARDIINDPRMRAALEAALGARRKNAATIVMSLRMACGYEDITDEVRKSCSHASNGLVIDAAACIEDLAAALKPFASVDWGYGGVLNTEDYNRARAVRERWGLK